MIFQGGDTGVVELGGKFREGTPCDWDFNEKVANCHYDDNDDEYDDNYHESDDNEDSRYPGPSCPGLNCPGPNLPGTDNFDEY